MRRPILALAAAACLAATACSPSQPADTVTPTVVVSTTMASSEPVASETSMEVSETPETSPSASMSTTGDPTGEDVDLATQTFEILPQDAMDKAIEKAGGGFVHSIELDWSRYHDAWVYELDVLVGTMDHDVDINADTGEVLELERDDTDDVEEAISLDSPMTWETARDTALDAVQGRITSWKLEYDDDYTAYEFDIKDSSGDEIEVEINVETGKVVIDD